MQVTVIGAGVAGLVSAMELAERGARVEVIERGSQIGGQSCSWKAGGMLAPWCERESAEPEVETSGRLALDWWPRHVPGTVHKGTLVVAPARDIGELERFSRRTSGFEWADAERISELEPDLGDRFRKALYFPGEAHLDPRRALEALAGRLAAMGVRIRFGVDATKEPIGSSAILDCRGYAARDALPQLRGVRGEMIIVHTTDVNLSRPVRLLHPRIPLYVVPREGGLFMIGATMIESDSQGLMTARSAIELLNGAFTLHPAFGEAEIVEMSADVRPAFADNLPRLIERGRTLYLNGLYRHGFLLSPAMARQAAERLLGPSLGARRVG